MGLGEVGRAQRAAQRWRSPAAQASPMRSSRPRGAPCARSSGGWSTVQAAEAGSALFFNVPPARPSLHFGWGCLVGHPLMSSQAAASRNASLGSGCKQAGGGLTSSFSGLYTRWTHCLVSSRRTVMSVASI